MTEKDKRILKYAIDNLVLEKSNYAKEVVKATLKTKRTVNEIVS